MTEPITGETTAFALSAAKKALNGYVFPDKARAACDALNLQRVRLERVNSPTDFARAVTEVLLDATGDKHLRMRHKAAESSGTSKPECTSSGGCCTSTRMPADIGYLRILLFAPNARRTYDSAMALVADTDALLVDLRGNPGGEPESVNYLQGYFFEQPVEVTGFYWRRGETTEHQPMYTAVVSGTPYRKPVYVLIDARTFSGAEQFAYDMQSLGRAQLIGETTGGGANPGDWVTLSECFELFVPTGTARNPYTKSNWEGVGVRPDVWVSSANAVAVGCEVARSTLGFSAAKPGSR